jgi:hemerythrin-like metal-binding protein
MNTPKWDDFPKTGFAAQDEEHEEIKQSVLRVLDAVNASRASSARVSAALTETLDRFLAHFEHEEAFMRTIRDPDLERHAEAHSLFLADVQRHMLALQEGGLTSQARAWIAGRFVHWFRLHIFRYDMGLGLTLMELHGGTVDQPPAPEPPAPAALAPLHERVLPGPDMI